MGYLLTDRHNPISRRFFVERNFIGVAKANLLQEGNLYAFFRLGKAVEESRTGGWRGRRFFFLRLGFEGGAEGAFDELGAMDFHGRQRAEFARKFLGPERESFAGSFAADEFRRQAGDGDGGFAAEGLERGAVNDLFAV